MSTATERCPVCGANLALVGRMHRCTPPANAPGRRSKFGWVRDVKPVDGAAGAESPASPNTPVSPNKAVAVSPNKAVTRNTRWREAHRDVYNAGMRDLMRRRRAKAKDSAASSS